MDFNLPLFFQSFVNFLLTDNRLSTLFLMICVIALWEILKKGAKKGASLIIRRSSAKTALIIIVLCLLTALIFLRW